MKEKLNLPEGQLKDPMVGSGQAKVSEESITIPTYKMGKPEPMPRFYEGKCHQGVKRHLYPYPMDDNLTTNKENQDYYIIHAENEFIDIGIIPELGGRIYYAEDKTNNYNWIYRNNVIKPSLVGMVGKWMSGAFAWSFPHHHGPGTLEPMDSKIEENEDGSKTIWISTTGRGHRMRALVGYTIFPNSSVMELTIHPMNRTPISNSFLFWVNPAVHVDETYQVIFPPSVQYITYHHKRDITSWPVADCRFNDFEYAGYDLSLFKNTLVPSSIFAWDIKDDYYGGYDHGQDAGTVWVGNHHVSSAKYWTDGNNEAGVRIWKKHTDNDGRNNELMVGFYSDNQPDYSWLQPYESKSGKMIWFPVRELEGLKYANRNGALNLEVTKEQTIKIRMNATSPHKMAAVVLKAKEQVLLQETININPAEPFKIDVPLPSGIQELDLDVALKDANGQILLYYKPAEHQTKYPRPEPMKPLAPPEEMKSVEELYLAGLRLHQFFNGGLDPMPYYKEALKRDPGDSRVNTQLGILNIKDFNWEEAKKHLQIAVDRVTSNYTKPKDGESLYYMGIVLRAQGKVDEAYDYFYRASWSYAWYAASFCQLAEIDCLKGNFQEAYKNVNKSLATISDNIKALNLKAIILRKLQKYDADKEQILKNLDNNKIDHQALYESFLLDSETGNTKEASTYLEQLTTLMREDVQSYLELATDYSSCGCYQEAVSLLAGLEKRGNNFPMVYYYLGYFWSKLGDQEKALNYYQSASKMPIDYCFPYRAEEVDILRHSMKMNPTDSLAPYYLGNLLYEHQPEQAIIAWEKSRQLDDSFYMVHRNLGLAYKEVLKDYKKAMISMEKALECNGDDSRLIFEMDILNELNKVSPHEKCEFLKKNIETVKKRDETLIRLAKRLVEDSKYDEAIHILTTNTIIGEFEGVVEMQNAFIDAYTLRGLDYIKKGEFDKALEDIESALAYPIRLIGRARHAQFFYIMSTIYRKLGDQEKADALLQKTLSVNIEPDGAYREFLYYKGLAFGDLGKNNDAQQLFQRMLSDAQSNKEDRSIFFTIFEAAQSNEQKEIMNHYLAGLAYQGLGENIKAKKEFSKVLELNPGHIWGKLHLESLAKENYYIS
jgi:tetratricopeptide (TPR) repeat protein